MACLTAGGVMKWYKWFGKGIPICFNHKRFPVHDLKLHLPFFLWAPLSKVTLPKKLMLWATTNCCLETTEWYKIAWLCCRKCQRMCVQIKCSPRLPVSITSEPTFPKVMPLFLEIKLDSNETCGCFSFPVVCQCVSCEDRSTITH